MITNNDKLPAGHVIHCINTGLTPRQVEIAVVEKKRAIVAKTLGVEVMELSSLARRWGIVNRRNRSDQKPPTT